jgi:hypothetical protein
MIIATCNPESFVPSYVEHLDPLEDAFEERKRDGMLYAKRWWI